MKHFGIEIELTGIRRIDLVNLLEDIFGSKAVEKVAENTDDKYKYHRVSDSDGDIWVVKRDRSIKPQQSVAINDSMYDVIDLGSTNTEYMVELVSPVLSVSKLPLLFDIMDSIRSIGGVVNKTCGLHVHIDKLALSETINLMNRFISEQQSIIKQFDVPGNRLAQYCKVYRYDGVVPEFQNLDDFLNFLWLNFKDSKVDALNFPRFSKSLRYYALNFYSLVSHGTIEYRLFNSTLDVEVLKMYIRWVIGFTYGFSDEDLSNPILSTDADLVA